MKTSFSLFFFLTFITFGVYPALAEDEYIFLFPSHAEYWNIMAKGAEDRGHELGKKVTSFFTDDDRAAEAQLNTCNAAIERKPRFITIASINFTVGLQCLKKAQKAGISLAEIDSSIPLDKAQEAGVTLSFSVGSDNELIGKTAAQYALSVQKQNSVVLILEGAPGSAQGKSRVDGFKTGLLLGAPNIKIAGSISADWDRVKAMNITQDFLIRFPKLDLIFAANDGMALGAVEGLRASARLGSVKVIGVDGTEAARKSVLQGEMSATVAQLPYLVGRQAIELAVDSTSGKLVPQRQLTETPVLTRLVLEQNIAPYLKYVR